MTTDIFPGADGPLGAERAGHGPDIVWDAGANDWTVRCVGGDLPTEHVRTLEDAGRLLDEHIGQEYPLYLDLLP